MQEYREQIPERSKLLVQHGFIKKDALSFYTYDEKKKQHVPAPGEDTDKDHADEEEYEEVVGQWVKTGFPKPIKHHKIVWEVYNMSIEETYFWVLNALTSGGYPTIYKTEDVFTAAESSAFFGMIQQRIGLQQDKISQFLAVIGKMIKELFQIVRELRIIDERVSYYDEVETELKKPIGERKKSAEITLKGIFIDLVQGGAKNPASVFGMARELEFTVLPDIFFDAPPMKKEEIESYVDLLEFNRNVITVMKRHLRQYVEWRDRTYDETKVRRKFTLHYLRQHFDIIKMYMVWVKPYLRYVERLTMKDKYAMSPDLVAAFEGSVVDIELLATATKPPFLGAQACVLATFRYRTTPSLRFQQEGYQRGPVHIGKMELDIRAYAWNEQQVTAYLEMKEQEDFELMKTIDKSVREAMEALGEELVKYITEAGETIEGKKEEAKKPSESMLYRWFGDFLPPQVAKQRKKTKKSGGEGVNLFFASEDARKTAFNVYKNFKKSHGMLMW